MSIGSTNPEEFDAGGGKRPHPKVAELPQRNAESVLGKLQEMDLRLCEQDKRVAAMQDALAAMLHRMDYIEQLYMNEKARVTGTGPTE